LRFDKEEIRVEMSANAEPLLQGLAERMSYANVSTRVSQWRLSRCTPTGSVEMKRIDVNVHNLYRYVQYPQTPMLKLPTCRRRSQKAKEMESRLSMKRG
jgi:hypothetical protein